MIFSKFGVIQESIPGDDMAVQTREATLHRKIGRMKTACTNKEVSPDHPMTDLVHKSSENFPHFQIPRLRSAEFVFHPPEYALQIQESLIDELYELQRGFQCVGKLMFLCRAATCPSRNPTLL